MNNSYIERYINSHKTKEKNWFEKTVTSAVTTIGAAGVVYGIWKMKGPFRKLLDQQSSKTVNDIFNKTLRKYDDRPVDNILKSYKNSFMSTARELTSEFETRIEESTLDHLNTSQSLKDSIQNKEKQIYDAYERIFRQNSTLPQNIMATKDQPPPISSAANQEIVSDSLARAKQRAIIKYLENYDSGGKTTLNQALSDNEFYNTEEYLGGDNIKDAKNKDLVKRTNAVHESLINEQEYAVIYNEEITPISNKARQLNATVKKATVENTSKIASPKNARQIIYGGLVHGTKADIAMLRENNYSLAGKNEGIFEDKVRGLTSGGTRPIKSTHHLLAKLGAFEYGTQIKRIVSILDNALEENVGLVDYRISVDSYGFEQEVEKRYLKIEFFHEKRKGKVFEARIPLATNGCVPAMGVDSMAKADKLFIVGDVFGARNWDDQRIQILNSTQLALEDFADALESSAFRGIGSFKDNPENFNRVVNRITGNIYRDLAPMTGALRDVIQQVGITPRALSQILSPGSTSPAKMRTNLNNFVLNVAHMDRLRKQGQKVALITLDLESLSKKRSGPEHLRNDPTNQVVKAGLVVTDLRDGNRMLANDELSSFHGYEYFKRNGFTASLKEWLASNVVPDGANATDIIEAYRKHLEDTGASKDIKDNRGFFAELKKKVKALKSTYEAQGYDVTFVTKYGAEFDLKAFEYNSDPEFVKMIKDKHIDIQATASVLKKAFFEKGALSQERMLQFVLNKTGFSPEAAGLITRGHSAKQSQDLIVKILQHLRKPSAGFGTSFSLLNVSDNDINSLINTNKLTSLHASPVVDSLITSALFHYQYQQYLNNPEVGLAAGQVSRLLKRPGETRGPITPFDIVKSMEGQVIPGMGVMSFTAASHGMIHGMTASLISLYDIAANPDNPSTKQWNQRLGQVWDIKPSTSWLTKHGHPKVTSLAYKKAFGTFMTTNLVNEMNRIHYPKADEAANAYTKTAMAKGVYTLDPNRWGDDAGRQLVRDTFMQNLTYSTTIQVALDDIQHSDPILHSKLLEYNKQAKLKLAQLFPNDPKAVTNPTADQLEKAYAVLAAEGMPLDLENSILSAHKFSGQTKLSMKDVSGKLLRVFQDPSGGISKLVAKIELEMQGMHVGNMSPQTRYAGARAIMQMVKTQSDGSAFGVPKGYDFAVDGTFIRKGYIGATKEILFGNVMWHAYEKYHQAKGQDKKILGKAIKAMAAKANAEADPEAFNLVFKRQDPDKITSFARYVGDMDMTISDIVDFAKTHDILTWNDKDVREIEHNKSKKAAFSAYRESLYKHIDVLVKEARSNHGTLEGLSREETEKYLTEAKSMATLLNHRVGDAKLVTVHDYSGKTANGKHGLYMLDIETHDFGSQYGINSMDGPFNPTFRADYLSAMKNSRFIDPDSISWLKQYPYYVRHSEFRSAKLSYQNFNDLILGKLSLKPMSLNTMDLFIRRKEKLDVEKVYKNIGTSLQDSNTTIADAVSQIERLVASNKELGDVAAVQHYEEQAEFLRDVLNKKQGKELLSSFRKSARFYTHAEVEEFSKLASGKGTRGTIALPLVANKVGDVYSLNIDEEVRGLCGQLVGDKTLTEEQIKQRAEVIKQSLRSADEASAAKMLMHVDDNGNLILRGGALVMPWDADKGNNFNKLSPDIWLSNPETEVKLEVMRQLATLHDMRNKKGTPDYVDQEKKFNRELTRYLMLGFAANKNSKLWLANQYEPPGIKKYHMGIEQIMVNAQTWMQEMNDGNDHISPQLSKGLNVKKTLGNIMNASLNTVLITEAAFRQAKVPEMVVDKGKFVRDTQTEIKYVTKLEESLKNKNLVKEITQGQRYLPGGIMYRFPVTQNASHSLIDVNYLVVPDEIGSFLGMNSNTYYAHSILSSLQGSDSDGDFAALHFREFRDIKSMQETGAKNRKILKEIVDNSELQRIISSNAVSTDSAGNVTSKVKLGVANWIVHFKDGKAVVASYEADDNDFIRTKFRTVNEELLDASESVKQITELAKGVARNQVGNKDGLDWFRRSETFRSQLPAISKQLIPSATNLLKKVNAQILTAAQAGRLPAGVAATEIMGSINHGLGGVLGQLPIELGKHVDPGELGKTMMIMDFWNNIDVNMANKESAYEHWNSFYDKEKWIKPPPESKRREIFDFITEEIRTANKLSKLTPESKNYGYSFNNIFMGSTGATYWDVRNLGRDFNYTVPLNDQPSLLREFGDAVKTRFNLDIDVGNVFKKGGKYGAIGAAALLGLSFFRPFNNSDSLNPIDAFIDLGPNVDTRINLINSQTELPRNVPLDMVNASFSREAFIKMNDPAMNNKRQKSNIINSILKGSQLYQPYEMYDIKAQSNVRYSNYTSVIPYMGTSDLNRRSQL